MFLCVTASLGEGAQLRSEAYESSSIVPRTSPWKHGLEEEVSADLLP